MRILSKSLLIGAIGIICHTGVLAQNSSDINSYAEADANGDGIIQTDEVFSMIDGYFIGTHDRGVMYIHSLIDYYFEQRAI